ncbi:hypothetical protein RRG08_052544 [Elysia crispata]|uniref:Uncharacterized protein n=1 Tax=Elysia crispata TaxID=231223 RepID=A0AAE0Z5K3_9GAST|nr:hypothetical protein RRG08_052544 [Elysia crispata]
MSKINLIGQLDSKFDTLQSSRGTRSYIKRSRGHMPTNRGSNLKAARHITLFYIKARPDSKLKAMSVQLNSLRSSGHG